jgi:hypothetical protein
MLDTKKHPVPGGYKYGNLALQVGEVSVGNNNYYRQLNSPVTTLVRGEAFPATWIFLSILWCNWFSPYIIIFFR